MSFKVMVGFYFHLFLRLTILFLSMMLTAILVSFTEVKVVLRNISERQLIGILLLLMQHPLRVLAM